MKEIKSKSDWNIIFKKLENEKHNNNIDLCKKYFYRDKSLNLKKNIFEVMENKVSLGDEFDIVDKMVSKTERKVKQLEKKRIDCLKSMILHNKQVPEKWIIQGNYKKILNKAMEEPLIFSYAANCKENHKKINPEDMYVIYKNKKLLDFDSSKKKFMSYINPYKYSSNSPGNPKIRKEYGNKIKNNYFNKFRGKKIIKQKNKIKAFSPENESNIKAEKNENKLPLIHSRLKTNEFKGSDDFLFDDINDPLMLTSIFHKEKEKEKKDKNENEKGKENNLEPNKIVDKENTKNDVEFPMIEL